MPLLHICVPLEVRFAAIAIGMRKAVSPEHRRFNGTYIIECMNLLFERLHFGLTYYDHIASGARGT